MILENNSHNLSKLHGIIETMKKIIIWTTIIKILTKTITKTKKILMKIILIITTPGK